MPQVETIFPHTDQDQLITLPSVSAPPLFVLLNPTVVGTLSSRPIMQRFQDAGKHFSEGLVTINGKIKEGDRSEYGAFYTKGVAFWAAVDQALQSQGDSLDNHVLQIFKTNYTESGKQLNLQKNLHLSPKTWQSLTKQFLDK